MTQRAVAARPLPVVARQHGVNHFTELELEEAPHLLLVARVGGEPLAAGSLRIHHSNGGQA